jgi:hypothetical protein
MSYIEIARDRLQSTREYVREIMSEPFPHEDSKSALIALDALLTKQLGIVSRTSPDAAEALTRSIAASSSYYVDQVLDCLGMLKNSASIRNPFEVHGPLKEFCKKLVAKDAHLILTFAWNYVPFTYPHNNQVLPKFVVIGLPASECGNALILPAAGHELGHSIWRVVEPSFSNLEAVVRKTIRTKFRKQLKEHHPNARLDDLVSMPIWRNAHEWAKAQCEEIFCDLIGLHIFGASYLYAFEYIVAPKLSEFRSQMYPSLRRRASLIAQAAKDLGIGSFPRFADRFVDEKKQNGKNQWDDVQQEVADTVLIDYFPVLEKKVKRLCEKSEIEVPKPDSWRNICAAFRQSVPASKLTGLPEIINAAWEVYLDAKFAPKEICGNKPRRDVLNEMVFKTIEILEIDTTLRETDDPEAEQDDRRAGRERKVQRRSAVRRADTGVSIKRRKRVH